MDKYRGAPIIVETESASEAGAELSTPPGTLQIYRYLFSYTSSEISFISKKLSFIQSYHYSKKKPARVPYYTELDFPGLPAGRGRWE